MERRSSDLSPDKPAAWVGFIVWEGQRYEIALTLSEYRQLLEMLDETFRRAIEVKKVGSFKTAPRQDKQGRAHPDTSAIRWWAHREGYVLGPGRIPDRIRAMWEEEGKPYPPPTERQLMRQVRIDQRVSSPVVLREIRREYALGYSIPQLAAKYDIPYTTLQAFLKRSGTELRSPGFRGSAQTAAVRRAIAAAAARKAAGLDPVTGEPLPQPQDEAESGT